MGRGRGQGSQGGSGAVTRASKKTEARTYENGFDQPRTRSDEEIAARRAEINSWSEIDREALGEQAYLESFIARLRSVNWEKYARANVTRHKDDSAESVAIRELESESAEYEVLHNILVDFKINKGFKDNPEAIPTAEQYEGQDLTVLSRTGRERKARRAEQEAREKAIDEMSIEEFKTQVNSADWFYEFIEDGRQRARAKQTVDVLDTIAKGHPEREKILAEKREAIDKHISGR